MEIAISFDRVSKQYGTGARSPSALSEVDLEVPEGQFLSVMGPSGSGKSTMLNLIAGLDSPTGGRVLVAGQDLATLSDDARSDLRLRHVATIFQSFNLFPTFTVEENVIWPLEFQGVRARAARDRTHGALESVGIPDAVHRRRPAELSGGEQQRVAIARALVIEPKVLLADEPTGNLDSHTGQVILDLVRRLNRERQLTVVMVTHSPWAATYGHRTVELRDGQIVRDVRAAQPGVGRVVPIRD